MIVDAHVHHGKLRVAGPVEGDTDMIINIADDSGIDKICVSSVKSLHYDIYEGNRDVFEAMKKYPDRILGYSVANPRYGEEAVNEFERCVKDQGFIGLKMHSHMHMYQADDPIVHPLMEKTAKLRVPVLFHADIRELRVLAERFSEVTFLVAHMGSAGALTQPTGDWISAINTGKRCENLILDTAASTMDAGMIEMAVNTLGPERVVYGSDMPLLDPSPQLSKIKDSDISDEDKRLILGDNMKQLLHLDERGSSN